MVMTLKGVKPEITQSFPRVLQIGSLINIVLYLLKVVNQTAHKLPKDPAGQRVQSGGEGHTTHQEQDVSGGQIDCRRTQQMREHSSNVESISSNKDLFESRVTYVEVGDSLHLLMLRDHMYDQRVPNQPHQHDEAKEGGDQPGVHQLRRRWALQRKVAH